jgi:DNA-binding CsgD family transcriptional regulator
MLIFARRAAEICRARHPAAARLLASGAVLGARSHEVDALFEREDELAVLSGAVAAAREGTGGVVMIDGPAGIGKSRLLSCACALGRAEGMDVFSACGVELEREIPFGLAAQLFATRLAGTGAHERERLLAGHAALAASLFDPAAPAPDDAQALVRGLHWLTINLTLPAGGAADAAARPLVLAVDDAHWCDRPSLGFLAYLATRLDELPVLLVVAARSREAASSAALLGWLRDPPTHRVLKPLRLTEEAVAQLVAVDLPDPEPAFVNACARVSGGNPFLASELVRALRADGIAPTADSVAAVERLVPESVLQSVLVRLARLPDLAQRLAGACAVLGDGASLRHAASLAGLEPEVAERTADALAAAHVLDPGEPLRFAHPLIATAVHADLPAFARARSHRRAAELLAADAVLVDMIAAHLLLSTPEGDGETVATVRRAAERALARGDAAAAVRLLERALAEPPGAGERADVLLELAAAAIQAGDPTADRHIAAALALQEAPADQVRSLVALARLRFQQGEHAASAGLVQDVVDRVGSDDPIAEELLVDEVSAGTFRAPLRPRADALMAPLLDAARAGRLPTHPGLLAHVTLRLALAGEPADDVRAVAERATAADPLVDPVSHGMLAGIVVQALVCVDELGAAESVADAALDAAGRRGSLLAYASASYHRAIPRYHRGALTDALADLDQALAASREGWGGADGWIGALQAEAHLECGDLAAARTALELASTAPDGSLDAAVVAGARARVALADHDPAGALRAAEAAGLQLEHGFGIDHPGLVPWHDTAALAAAALGDHDQARRLARAGLERARRHGAPRSLGLALRTAALVEDDGEQGLQLLNESEHVVEDSPSALALAHVLVSHGAALRRAGQRTAAQPPLRRGLELADRMAATPLADTALDELRATGARPRRAATTGADALTPTEQRVARLAAQGLTSAQIAQALFVTPRTIQTHLTHTYRKLDITSRRQLPAALGAGFRPVA